MHHIFPDGQSAAPDHAVGLGDAGEPSKGQDTEHQKGRTVSDYADPPCNFQQTPDSSDKERAFFG